jgi:hypothetical protein
MNLVLHVKSEWFDLIKVGFKKEEYRLVKPYWISRLSGKDFDGIKILKGYPRMKIWDDEKMMQFPWNGYEIKMVKSPEFGDHLVQVFAIKLVRP